MKMSEVAESAVGLAEGLYPLLLDMMVVLALDKRLEKERGHGLTLRELRDVCKSLVEMEEELRK